ncbi:23S rRNA (uracil(1939)-C(5))-methyltransferase RlmD [Loigolactobacillus bifermentans]|jgi:23S rRNA (uracil-5-)-methyltransferase RumA|uniref:RNA methyltransferase n=1 Tax=Loigolactobacillus bifermentans DSM 20003 TaxID=1423726 RepID=A0A0R1GKL3_9LACO|nr:23S rRNA (uracil(1939)-C(5))-methyltransferase RlmD [Loigolactobacillus bifermentans]KRK34425.1 RNA methyltransferase [Loigolactobacillus bifermentans DSM 20003]QGG60136.1 23S rRNA (uracil(1939)-C(5))-methyltransferase RlmD [Loigolactobacillus bifermentans]
MHTAQPHYQHHIKRGQKMTLTIKRLGINGEGIGYFKRTIVFVPEALPGEVITAEVTDLAPRFVTAKLTSIRQRSPHRVTPADADYFGIVGGIELEHLDYPGQLAFKADLVQQSLTKFKPRGYQHYTIKPTIGMTEPYAYRNKAQFQVRREHGQVMAGLYRPNSHDLVDLATFKTQRPLTMAVMRQLVAALQKFDVSIFDERQHHGALKTIAIRESFANETLQVTFITTGPELPHQTELLMFIATHCPAVVSVMHNINPGRTSRIWGRETRHLAGETHLIETINGLNFALSAPAFFQLNPIQTAKLYALAQTALALAPQENVVDAYCGVGTVGLPLAQVAGEVRGMDIIPAAIEDAKQNAKLNHIANVHYEVGAAETILPQWLAQGFQLDALIVDPPRLGLADTLRQTILKYKPKKFVYISCNPATLARDLVDLTKVYQVDYLQPLDMFPQTARVEVLVKLTRR